MPGPPPVLRERAADARAVAAGVLAAAAGLGVAELAAALLGGAPTPVVAVGEAFVDRVPPWLKDWAVAAFGTADKAVLVAGVLGTLVLLSAGTGLVAARRRAPGLLAAAGLVALAAAAATEGPGSPADVLPTLLGGAVSLVSLDRLTRRVAGRASPAPGDPGAALTEHPVAADGGRRSFLRAAAVVAGLAAAGGGLGRLLGGRRQAVEAARTGLDLPRPLPAADPPPGVGSGVPGAPPWRTPNDVFYRIDTALAVPLVDPQTWRLRVHGLVEQELDVGFDDLVSQGLVDRWVTLTCVSNDVGGSLVGNALWTGLPVATLLAQARPLAEADAVLSTSADGWTAGTPLETLSDGRDAMLAVAMNGEPLPVEHGFPVRMVVPGLYGYVSATKWLVDLEVTRFDRAAAYWTTRGWAERGPVKTASRIDVPRPGADVPAGRVAVAGVAWAQHRGIAGVEVRLDGGPWRPARLAAAPSADTWRQWSWVWEATPGSHRLQVRATDGAGEVQTGEQAGPAPDGATGWHEVTVEVRA